MDPEQNQPDNYQPPVAVKPTTSASAWVIPLSILLGFGLVAGAIYFSGTKGVERGATAVTNPQGTAEQIKKGDPANIIPVSEADHIRGNPNAPIVIVEYSDYDCPFCKNFHETMQRIMDEYGADGKVAWVYRHFPLESLHVNAPLLANAAECVAAQTGNEGFWTFSDKIFGERGVNEQTNLANLNDFAKAAGADVTKFNNCLDNRLYQDDVTADLNNAIAVGGNGTPHSIIMVGGELGVINGAQPYSTVKQIIDQLLAQIEGQAS